MARPPYTRARHIAMQAVMALILAGAIGLAALTDSHLRRERSTPLVATLWLDDIGFRLPQNWQTQTGNPDDPTVLASAVEPESRGGRTLELLRQQTDDFLSPLEYLDRSGQLQSLLPTPGQRPHLARTTIGGWPAFIIVSKANDAQNPSNPPPGDGNAAGETEVHKTLLAAVELPTREAVTVRLIGDGEPDQSDLQLLAAVIDSLQFPSAPLPPPGGAVTLDNGVKISAPPGFRALTETNPLRDAQILLRTDSESSASPGNSPTAPGDSPTSQTTPNRSATGEVAGPGWASISLIPFQVFPGETGDSVLAILALDDPRWLAASITILKNDPSGVDQYRITLDPKVNADFPRQAFIANDPNGRGVLAIMRSQVPGDVDFDNLWKTLSSQIAFPNAASTTATTSAQINSDAIESLTAGAALIQSLGAGNSLATLGPTPRFYIQLQQDNAIGWTKFDADSTGIHTWTVARQLWNGQYVQFQDAFSAAADSSSFKSHIELRQTVNDDDDALAPVFQQDVQQGFGDAPPGKILLALTMQRFAPIHRQSLLDAPPQFVPGGLAPAAISQVKSGRVALRTDRLCPLDIAPSAGWLTLIAEPDDSAQSTTSPAPSGNNINSNADSPTPAAPLAAPLGLTTTPSPAPSGANLRCVRVEINGAGQFSRWYFRPDGSLDSIQTADGRLRSSDEQEIQMRFSDQPPLKLPESPK